MLSGSIDEGAGSVGLLCVTGGSQVRTGAHRMLHRIARDLSGRGVPVFRFDRRGVGDSDGADPGYRDSGADLIAAAQAFRREAPGVRTLVGFGLCDGATALALRGRQAGVDALVLANPWLVETKPDELAPAATRAHYRGRFLSRDAWSNVFRGRVDILGAARSLLGAATAKEVEADLASEVARDLKPYAGRLLLILSEGDGTAIAARACWNADAFAHVRGETVVTLPSNSHTFARTGDIELVVDAIDEFVRQMKVIG